MVKLSTRSLLMDWLGLGEGWTKRRGHLEPVRLHGHQELGRERESCLCADDRVDAASGAQRGLADARSVRVDPVLDLRGRKRRQTVKAAAAVALLDLPAVA